MKAPGHSGDGGAAVATGSATSTTPTTASVAGSRSASAASGDDKPLSRSGSTASGASVGSSKGGTPSGTGTGAKGAGQKLTLMEKRRNKHGKVLRSLLLSKMSQHMASPSTQREVCKQKSMLVVGGLVGQKPLLCDCWG